MKYIGSLIGEGKSRKVYEYLLDPNYVVKINNELFTEFANPNMRIQCVSIIRFIWT